MPDASRRGIERPARRAFPHGGARNRGDRVSVFLTDRQCNNLIAASETALHICQPFNRFITIHWENGGIPDAGAAAATGRFVKLASDWMRARDHRLIWAWVRENDMGDGRKGSHVHLLIHVPLALDPLFRVMPLRWVKSILSEDYRRRTLRTQRIKYAQSIDHLCPAYQAELSGKVGYMLKGATRAAGEHLGLSRSGEGGRVIGKRSGVWQGWRDAFAQHVGDVRTANLPYDFGKSWRGRGGGFTS